jgi:thiol:disulfide interchange protein DsbD
VRSARRRPARAGEFLSAFVLALTLATTAFAAENPVSAKATLASDRVRAGESVGVEIAVTIAEGWHINGNEPGLEFLIPTTLEFELPAGMKANDVRFPPAAVRRLALAGDRDLKLYEGTVRITAALHRESAGAPHGDAAAVLRYLACNDSLCLRPSTIRLPLELDTGAIAGVAAGKFNDEAADRIARLVGGGLWVMVPGMLLLGFALNLTPCVYPLLSVTIAYFGSQAHNRRSRKLGLAVAYTLGIALTFSALGVSAALSGGLFGRALTNPLVLAGVSGVMLALALSCFGVYQLRIPAGLALRVGRAAHGALGALFMGMTMGLVAAPCVAPVVVGLLVFIGSRGDPLLGFGLFFLLALGLGVPYVALAVAAGSIARLPRSGAWLQWTEHLFGCILVAMAIYFAEPVLPDKLSRVLMPAFLTLAVTYLAFFDRAGRDFRTFVFGRWAVGAMALVAIAFTYLPAGESQEMLAFEPFSVQSYDRARTNGKPFIVEFTAEWCLPCKEMEERTFTDARVISAAHGMTFLSVDMTTSDEQKERILQSFDVVGAPTTVFFGADGKERTRRVGFVPPEDFVQILSQLGTASGEAPARDRAARGV